MTACACVMKGPYLSTKQNSMCKIEMENFTAQSNMRYAPQGELLCSLQRNEDCIAKGSHKHILTRMKKVKVKI